MFFEVIDCLAEIVCLNKSDKEIATEKNEPYVNILGMTLDPKDISNGAIELDWNEHFVKFLHDNGYTGTSDEDVVNKWFNDVCRTVLIQEQADLDYGLQEEMGDEIVVTKTEPGTESED